MRRNNFNIQNGWNQVAIQTNDVNALKYPITFPFVLTVLLAQSPYGPKPQQKKLEEVSNTIARPTDYATNRHWWLLQLWRSMVQVHIHNGDFLHTRLPWAGHAAVAVIDGDIFKTILPYLHLTADQETTGQVLGTWDFVAGNASSEWRPPAWHQLFSTYCRQTCPASLLVQHPKLLSIYTDLKMQHAEYP